MAVGGKAQTVEELDALREECKRMVTRRAGLSALATAVPVLGADVGADIGLLMEMIPSINRKFGLTPEQIDDLDPQLRKITLVAISSIGSEMIGRIVTKQIILRALQAIGGRMATKGVARLVPVLGQAVAASISFGAMKLVGDAHVDDCYAVALETLRALEHQPAAEAAPAPVTRARRPARAKAVRRPPVTYEAGSV